ncbi:MAG: hypothetical protein ABSC94_31420 [Polyangiaceae bacterium]
MKSPIERREVGELTRASPTTLVRERRAISDSFNPASLIDAIMPPSNAIALRRRR